MSTNKTATFDSDVKIVHACEVEGVLSGQTIVRLDADRVGVQTALNSHVSDYNASETANASARQTLADDIADNRAHTDAGDASLSTALTDAQTSLSSDIANETTARLAFQSSQNAKNNQLDQEIADLNALHVSDDARLTNIEATLDQRDDDIEAKIDAQISAHNTDIANLDPRVASLEGVFAVDPVNKTITVPADYNLVVLGDFNQGS